MVLFRNHALTGFESIQRAELVLFIFLIPLLWTFRFSVSYEYDDVKYTNHY